PLRRSAPRLSLAARRPLLPYATLFRSADRGFVTAQRHPSGGQRTLTDRPCSGAASGATVHRTARSARLPGADQAGASGAGRDLRSEEHTSELQSRENLVGRPLLANKK